MNRRKFIRNAGFAFVGIAASGSLLSCVGSGTNGASRSYKKLNMPKSSNNLYIGDLHNHCNLTYRPGGMCDAFEAARQQLDFVAVAPLCKNDWRKCVDMSKGYNEEKEFITFLSYECQDVKYGDHVALNYDFDAPLTECSSVEDLKR
jgi:ribosomal protein S14